MVLPVSVHVNFHRPEKHKKNPYSVCPGPITLSRIHFTCCDTDVSISLSLSLSLSLNESHVQNRPLFSRLQLLVLFFKSLPGDFKVYIHGAETDKSPNVPSFGDNMSRTYPRQSPRLNARSSVIPSLWILDNSVYYSMFLLHTNIIRI